MGIFDEIGKAVTQTASTVGDVATQGAETLGTGVIEGATALGEVTIEAGNVAEQGATALGGAVINTFDSLTDEVNDGLQKAADRLNQIQQSSERLILDSKVTQFVERFSEIVGALSKAAVAVAARAGDDVITCIRDSAKNKTLDTSAFNNLQNLMDDPDVQAALNAAAQKDLCTFAIAFGGTAGVVAGVQGIVGFAIPFPNIQDARLFGSVGGTIGAQAGADEVMSLGLYFQKPADMAGPGISLDGSASFEEGFGLDLSIDILNLDIAGVVVTPEEGAGASAAIGAGYTWVSNTAASMAAGA